MKCIEDEIPFDVPEAVDGITTYEWTITDTGIGMSRELDWEWRL